MTIKKNYIISFFIAILLASFTANYSNNLKDGDITKYIKVYNFSSYSEEEKRFTVSQDPAIDIWGNKDQTSRDYYSKHLTSREITHFVTISFFSKFLTYTQYLSVINFFLIFLICILLIKNNTNYLIILSLLFTNYYMIILYFGAERLKIGVIFGLIALILYDNKKLSYGGLIISVLSHFQLILLYFAIFFRYIYHSIVKIFLEEKLSIYFLILMIIFLILLALSTNHIFYKINQIGSPSLLSLLFGWIKLSIFFVLTYINYKKFSFLFFLFLPFYIASIVLGTDRLIIVVFSIFFYFSIQKNRGVNLPLILISTYFGIKSLLLVFPIINCGTLNMDIIECRTSLIENELAIRNFAQEFLDDN